MWIRKGYCCKCGDCCRLSGVPCEHLDIDGKLCTVYENRSPELCLADFPQPTQLRPVKCTYYFVPEGKEDTTMAMFFAMKNGMMLSTEAGIVEELG